MHEQYKSQQKNHLRHCVELGLQKLDQYHKHLDDTPVYLAALVLHPRYKWRWIERKWSEKPGWIKRGKKAVENFWKEHEGMSKEIIDEIPEKEPFVREKKTGFRAFCDGEFSDDETAGSDSRDECSEWCKLDPERGVDNPIAYWWSNRYQWPCLSRFALDLLAIPAMSAEPERVFSNTGNTIRPHRACLKSDIVAAGECLKQWDKSGVIEWK